MAAKDNNQQLISVARRRAFEAYLRFGHRSEKDTPASQEAKALDPSARLSPKPTSLYVWRSAGDDRVRASHALNDGRIFAWDRPPVGGHPGNEPNCRCWAEPYFGDPDVPDNLQPLRHVQNVDTSGVAGWSSIETLTRPDGSMAESVVVLADGTQVRSRFWRTLIARTVTLATGGKVRIDTDAGVQTVYLGDDKVPLFRSAWTVKGPMVTGARQRVAFLLQRGPLWPKHQLFAEPGPGGSSIQPTVTTVIAAAAQALLAVHAAQQVAPTSQALGDSDKPVIALRAWTAGESGAMVILVDALTEEQLRRDCRHLSEIQEWTNDTASALLAERSTVLARQWGSLVHGQMKRTFDALKAASPLKYHDLEAEFSISDDPNENVPYGQRHSTRLDFIEVRDEYGVVCDYDIKTGQRGFDPKKLLEHAKRLALKYPGMTTFIIEVRPQL